VAFGDSSGKYPLDSRWSTAVGRSNATEDAAVIGTARGNIRRRPIGKPSTEIRVKASGASIVLKRLRAA
jgi:hypothetical protein